MLKYVKLMMKMTLTTLKCQILWILLKKFSSTKRWFKNWSQMLDSISNANINWNCILKVLNKSLMKATELTKKYSNRIFWVWSSLNNLIQCKMKLRDCKLKFKNRRMKECNIIHILRGQHSVVANYKLIHKMDMVLIL